MTNVVITWGEARNVYYIRRCGTRELLKSCAHLTEARAYIQRRGWILCDLVER